MTFDVPKETRKNEKISVNQEFYVRTIAAWLLLLIPGLLSAIASGHWLLFLVIGPAIAALLTVWAYDLSQFLRQPGNKVKKLILISLFGLGLAVLLSLVRT